MRRFSTDLHKLVWTLYEYATHLARRDAMVDRTIVTMLKYEIANSEERAGNVVAREKERK